MVSHLCLWYVCVGVGASVCVLAGTGCGFSPGALAGLGRGLQRREGPKPPDVHPWVLQRAEPPPGVCIPQLCLRVFPINCWKERGGTLGKDSHTLGLLHCTARVMQVMKAALLSCSELCGEGGFKKS